MEVTRFIVNMIEENCYLVYDETGEAALIDCGAFYDEEKKAIRQFLESHNLRLVRMFNTHAHFDHLFGAHYIYKEYGVKMEIAAAERETYESAVQQMQQFMHSRTSPRVQLLCRWRRTQGGQFHPPSHCHPRPYARRRMPLCQRGQTALQWRQPVPSRDRPLRLARRQRSTAHQCSAHSHLSFAR